MEQLKKDLRVALDAMRPRECRSARIQWKEPTDGQVLAVSAASFAFFMFLFWGGC